MRNDQRLAKLEQHTPTAKATGPGYVSAPTEDELPAALAKYLERWPDSPLPIKAYIGFSPDDWNTEP